MDKINNGKLVAKPLGKIRSRVCYRCGETATHQVLDKQEKEKFSCTKQICLVPLVFTQRRPVM